MCIYLKKGIKFILPVFLIGLMLIPSVSANAAYGVTVGTVYTYNYNTCTWSVTAGANSATGNGYMVDDGHFQEGTSFNVEVDA